MKHQKYFCLVFIFAAVMILGLAGCAETSGGDHPTPTAVKGTAVPPAESTETPGNSTPTGGNQTPEAPTTTKAPGLAYQESFDNNEESDYSYLFDSAGGVQPAGAVFQDEMLWLGWDGSAFFDQWFVYTPDYEYNVEDHDRVEFKIDVRTKNYRETPGETFNPVCTFVGCRVTGPEPAYIPYHKEACGFWIAFSEGSKEAPIFPDWNYWQSGHGKIILPEPFDELHTLSVVDSKEEIAFYMTTSAGEQILLLRADLTGDKIVCYDGAGTKIWDDVNNIYKNEPMGFFKVFSHYSQTTIDNVSITEK